MIRSISTVSFGKHNVSTAESKKKDNSSAVGAGIAGAGAAGAVATGNKVISTYSSVAGRANRMMTKGTSKYEHFKSGFLEWIRSAKSTKFFKPLAKLAEKRAMKVAFGTISAISAVAVCSTDLVNMFKVGGDMLNKAKTSD